MMKLSFESFLLEGGLKILLSLKFFFAFSTISLNVEPIKIFDRKIPFGRSIPIAKSIAVKVSSPV